MAYTRERVCVDCSRIDTIRKDSKAVRCVSCNSSFVARKGVQPATLNKQTACLNCGKLKSPRQFFCSNTCKNEVNRVNRTCKTCNVSFVTSKSRVYSSSNNSSGNFCSTFCYYSSMRLGKTTTARLEFNRLKKTYPVERKFCAVCGTRKHIHIHHIIPLRLTEDNRDSNLICLCARHHKQIESITQRLLLVVKDYDLAHYILCNILHTEQQVAKTLIKDVLNARISNT